MLEVRYKISPIQYSNIIYLVTLKGLSQRHSLHLIIHLLNYIDVSSKNRKIKHVDTTIYFFFQFKMENGGLWSTKPRKLNESGMWQDATASSTFQSPLIESTSIIREGKKNVMWIILEATGKTIYLFCFGKMICRIKPSVFVLNVLAIIKERCVQ